MPTWCQRDITNTNTKEPATLSIDDTDLKSEEAVKNGVKKSVVTTFDNPDGTTDPKHKAHVSLHVTHGKAEGKGLKDVDVEEDSQKLAEKAKVSADWARLDREKDDIMVVIDVALRS